MPINWEDKRRNPRVNIRTPLTYRVRGEPRSQSTVCDNISAGGLSFTGERFVPSQATLMLEVSLLSRVLYPVGRVMWVSPLPHSDRNRIGVKFLEFPGSEMKYLEDYTNNAQKNIFKRKG